MATDLPEPEWLSLPTVRDMLGGISRQAVVRLDAVLRPKIVELGTTQHARLYDRSIVEDFAARRAERARARAVLAAAEGDVKALRRKDTGK